MRLHDGIVDYRVSRDGSALILRFLPLAEFRMEPHLIQYRELAQLSSGTLSWMLLGSVMGFWLDTSGWTVLHGAAVEVGDGALAFLASSGTGKSTIAAGFLRAGYRVIGDDHVALQRQGPGFMVRPALPWLKVRSDVAGCLGVDHAQLPELHATARKRRFDLPDRQTVTTPLPLLRVFVLHRENRPHADVVLTRIRKRDAVLELIRQAYSPKSADAVGLQADRLATFADVASQVEMWRVNYAGGLDRLDAVCRACVESLGEPALA